MARAAGTVQLNHPSGARIAKLIVRIAASEVRVAVQRALVERCLQFQRAFEVPAATLSWSDYSSRCPPNLLYCQRDRLSRPRRRPPRFLPKFGSRRL